MSSTNNFVFLNALGRMSLLFFTAKVRVKIFPNSDWTIVTRNEIFTQFFIRPSLNTSIPPSFDWEGLRGFRKWKFSPMTHNFDTESYGMKSFTIF